MATNVVHNIRQKSNENLKLTLEILDTADDPLDITGVIARMQIRESKDSESEIIWSGVSGEDEEITVVEEDSTVFIDIPTSIVLTWTFSTAYYDVVIDFSETESNNIIEGKVMMSPGVTYPVTGP